MRKRQEHSTLRIDNLHVGVIESFGILSLFDDLLVLKFIIC